MNDTAADEMEVAALARFQATQSGSRFRRR